MSSTKMSGGKQVLIKAEGYSEDYVIIRKEAESNWPEWKVLTYNVNFATSKHAKKVSMK